MAEKAEDAKAKLDAKAALEKKVDGTSQRAGIGAIVEQASKLNSKVLDKALRLEQGFREATRKELSILVEQIKAMANKDDGTDLEQLYKMVLERCQQDLDIMKRVNTNAKMKQQSFPVKSNKLIEILEGTLAFLRKDDGKLFYELLEGKVTAEYAVGDLSSEGVTRPGDITVLGENVNGLGNSRGTFLKSVVIAIYLQMKKQKLSQVSAKEMGFEVAGSWVDQSAMVQVYPTKDLDDTDMPADCSFVFTDENTQRGLAVIHSYFGFGGGHFPDLRNKNKPFQPLDCSSGITLLNEYPCPVTTVDQLFNARLRTRGFAAKVDGAEAGIQKWVDSSPENPVLNQCELVTDLSKVQPGDTYVVRKFDLKKDAEKVAYGASGHTVVALSPVQADGRFFGIGWGRDMPKQEGYGVDQFLATDEADQVKAFYRPFKAKS